VLQGIILFDLLKLDNWIVWSLVRYNHISYSFTPVCRAFYNDTI
jgi:hypothetical protein